MFSELNLERSDCKVSEPHTAHPASSNFAGDVALQNSSIIFLLNEESGGGGGKASFEESFTF